MQTPKTGTEPAKMAIEPGEVKNNTKSWLKFNQRTLNINVLKSTTVC